MVHEHVHAYVPSRQEILCLFSLFAGHAALRHKKKTKKNMSFGIMISRFTMAPDIILRSRKEITSAWNTEEHFLLSLECF